MSPVQAMGRNEAVGERHVQKWIALLRKGISHHSQLRVAEKVPAYVQHKNPQTNKQEKSLCYTNPQRVKNGHPAANIGIQKASKTPTRA
jgi:hypothetical protein